MCCSDHIQVPKSSALSFQLQQMGVSLRDVIEGMFCEMFSLTRYNLFNSLLIFSLFHYLCLLVFPQKATYYSLKTRF